jgi:hypothetical protein
MVALMGAFVLLRVPDYRQVITDRAPAGPSIFSLSGAAEKYLSITVSKGRTVSRLVLLGNHALSTSTVMLK